MPPIPRNTPRKWVLTLGCSTAVLPSMPDNSIDAVVTDPPAGIAFMGRGWDSFGVKPPARSGYKAHNETTMLAGGRGLTVATSAKNRAAFIAFLTPIMAECLRVLKPGGYALAWALPRTSHWTATALEDAGFEIRDVITHLFGQGFPKGKGCLKPAVEHWVLCRRPGPRVLPLNIDDCRVGWQLSDLDPRQNRSITPRAGLSQEAYGGGPNVYGDGSGVERRPFVERMSPKGRWPANCVLSHHESCVCRGTKRVRGSNGVRGGDQNGAMAAQGVNKYHRAARKDLGQEVGYAGPDGTEEVEDWACHPECAVRLLDEQAGVLYTHAGKYRNEGAAGMYGPRRKAGTVTSEGNSGGPSRFFYVAKAPGRERWFYCTDCGDAFAPGERARHGHRHVDGDGKPDWRHLESHPTQKSLALMRWLIKLACPAGGLVLDPFAGSGSTGVACLTTGRRFVGIESDPGYHAIALRRLKEAADAADTA